MKIGIIYMASGFGNRFGANKLLEELGGKPLFLHGLEAMAQVKKQLEKESLEDGQPKKEPRWQVRLLAVSQYEEIRSAAVRCGAEALSNSQSDQGITASIRLGTEAMEEDTDLYVYCVADQPRICGKTIAAFLRAFAETEYGMGCVAAGERRGNPTVFRAGYREELLKLTGDRGGSQLMKRWPEDVFTYQVEETMMKDVDVREDLMNCDVMKCDLLIRDAMVMTDYETLKSHMDIAVKDGRILSVHPTGAKEYEAGETLDGSGKLFMPGLTDSHMHTGQQLLKGLVLDAKPIIWTRVMLPFESSLSPEKMRWSAENAALEMIKSGTTSFVDAGSYFMDSAAEVYARSGLRGCLTCSTIDEPGLPKTIAMDAKEAISQNDRLYESWNGKGNLKVYYSLRALNSCSKELTELAVAHSRERDAMLQAHMNEYQGEIDGIVAREGMRPYEYLEKMGALSPRFLGAHSLLLSEEEKELIRKRGVKLCHCPFSNCGKAVPDTPDLVKRGILPGLGSDGAAHGGLSIWNEMRIFRSIMNIYHGVPNRDPKVMPAELLFRMVWEGGAAAIGEEGSCGRIQAGYQADLIGIRLDAGRLLPSGNLIHTMFECAESGDVSDMIVAGKILMKNREVKTLDEERIRWQALSAQGQERI